MADQKAGKGMGMEGWVARWYARTRQNDMADFLRDAGAVAKLSGRSLPFKEYIRRHQLLELSSVQQAGLGVAAGILF